MTIHQVLATILRNKENQYYEVALYVLYEYYASVGDVDAQIKYADKLHQCTSCDVKAMWKGILKDLQVQDYQKTKASPTCDVEGDQAQARTQQLDAEAVAKEERRVYLAKIRELARQQRDADAAAPAAAAPAAAIQTIAPPKIQLDIIQHTAVAGDLLKLEAVKGLKQKYDAAVAVLSSGEKCSRDNSKYVGHSVRQNDRNYTVFHDRLNDEHRIFYVRIGTKIVVLQAFGHDLIASRVNIEF